MREFLPGLVLCWVGLCIGTPFPSSQPSSAPSEVFSSTLVTTNSGTHFYTNVASNGQYIYASTTGEGIFMSSDYGNTIYLTFPAFQPILGIACSSTGQIAYATLQDGIVYRTMNSGQSWQTISSQFISLYAVTTNFNGSALYLTSFVGEAAYYSHDYGNTFNQSSVNGTVNVWTAIACSGTGKFVTGVSHEGIFYSDNFGVSYSLSDAPTSNWYGITMSSTGQYQTACRHKIGLYLSKNYGVHWNIVLELGVDWYSVSANAAGSIVYATVFNGGVYASFDYSENWFLTDSPDPLKWNAISVSSSGQYVTATVYQGDLYTNHYNVPSSSPTSSPSLQPQASPTSSPTDQPTSVPSPFQMYSTSLVEINSEALPYHSLASSANGQFIFASAGLDGIYMSPDYGNTFYSVYNNDTDSFLGISCSSSGQYVNAASVEGLIYQSSNYGADFQVLNLTSRSLYSVATNGNGSCIYATSYYGSVLYYSHNYGISWSKSTISSDTSVDWDVMSCSQSGQYVTAISLNDGIFYSHDFGVNYFSANAEISDWTGVAMSADGQSQVACRSPNGIYVSDNFGVSWTLSYPLNANWYGIACDVTGTYVFAIVLGGGVYVSLDGGKTFYLTDSPDPVYWATITMSSTGQYVVAGVLDGFLYTNQYNIPSSIPSNMPSGRPTGYPSGVPSMQPTGSPSLQPHTSYPTSQPSAMPSCYPTAQPTSYPTYVHNTVDQTVVVTSTGPTVTYVFNNLGCGSSAFVSASILVSYLNVDSLGYINVVAGVANNTMIVVNNCAPVNLCGEVLCAINVNATSVLSCEGGGSITLTASTVNLNDNGVDTLCTYEGTTQLQFAMSYTVSVNSLPTWFPTPAPTQPGNGVIVLQASPDSAFYVVVVVTLLFVALGVLIIRLREGSKLYTEEKLIMTCMDTGMIGYHLASEVFYIIVLFDRGLIALASSIISIRLASFIPAIYFMVVMTTGRSALSNHYDTMMNRPHMFQNATIYSIITVLMLLDQSLVRYIPWKESPYSKLSRGFPDQHIFKTAMISKMLQTSGAVIAQVVGDISIFASSSDKITLALTVLYLVSSVLTVVMLAITNALRIQAGKFEVDHSEEREGTISVVNPVRGSVKGIEMSDIKTLSLSQILVRIIKLEESESLLQEDVKTMKMETEEFQAAVKRKLDV